MHEVQNPGQVISHLVYEQTTNNVQMKASQHMPSREGEDPCMLNEWVSTVKLLIENYIKQLKSRGHETRKQKKNTRCRTVLRELYNEYVLVPADKASNNIIIVCKKYYTEVIRNELAGKIGKVSTYVYCRDSVDQIVEKHSYMHNAKVKVAEDMKRLPGFYWMPKLHRNPYGHLHNETFI